MQFLVYGAGAVGGYIGAQLAQQGHAVTLITRAAAAEQINTVGLLVEQGGSAARTRPTAVTTLIEAFNGGPPYDAILLGMKSYDLEAAIPPLAALCDNASTLITLQNGIDVERPCIEAFGAQRVLAGSLTTPVSKRAANRLVVERTDRGLGLSPTRRGQDVSPWVTVFRDAGIDTVAVPDHHAMKWSKALLNIVGNASSAILGQPPGEIYASDPLFDLELRMLREALAVMHRLRLPVVDLPGSSARQLALGAGYVPRLLLKPALTRIVAKGRGDKMPSFYIDLASGRGKSEVIFHNGAIAAHGRELGIPTPVNATLSDVLMQLTRGEVPRSAYDHNPERLLTDVRRAEAMA